MRIAQEPVDFLQELCGDFLGDAKRRDWQSVSAEVEVQLIAQDNNETYVLARSRPRAQKETAMRSRLVRGLMRDLIRLRRVLRHGRLKDPDKVLLQLGRLKERYRKAWCYLKIGFQDLRLSWRWDRHALRLAVSRDGAYLLRTNLEGSDPAKLWTQYVQLTEVEAVFRALKSDLAIRPIWHFTPKRVEAPHHGRLPGVLSVGMPQTQTQGQRPFLDPLAVARPIWSHPNGRGLVQVTCRRLHLLGTCHPTRGCPGGSYPPAQLASAPATSSKNLPDRSSKCVDNLSPFFWALRGKGCSDSRKMRKSG